MKILSLTPYIFESSFGCKLLTECIGRYDEWLNIFPFDIPFFCHLKAYFSQNLPLLKNIDAPNLFTGKARAEFTTKESLKDFLLTATSILLTEINTLILYQQGILHNPKRTARDMLVAERRVELQELKQHEWKDRKDFIKMLKRWLKGEQKFLKKIHPLMDEGVDSANFIKNIIRGIRQLQINDSKELAIRAIR